MPPTGGGRSGSDSGPASRPTPPLAVRRLSASSAQGNSGGSVSGCKSTASEGTGHSVPRSVSSTPSYSEWVSGSGGVGGSGTDDSDSDSEIYNSWDAFERNPEGWLVGYLFNRMPYHGRWPLLFETPSGFALFTFFGGHCYLPDSVDDIWAKFDTYVRSLCVVCLRGFRSFEDKSSAINADTGVDKKLVDLINDWYRPGMKLCVGKPEYKVIIESKLKIPCMYCQTVMEIMWGIQHQMRKLVPQEKSELTKEDRLPMSQGLKKFLNRNGFDVKPEMVSSLVELAMPSGMSCESWDILKLAIAVKVICCPDEELTDFHEVLAQDEISKLKGDALKYNGITGRSNWLRTCRAAVSTYQLRIAKKKLLGSLVKEAYEAEAAEVCEKGKLQGESKQIREEQAILDNGYSSGLSPRPPTLPITPALSNPSTCLVGDEVVRRSPRLNPKFYQNISGYKHAWLDGTPSKRRRLGHP